jgi:hypothetical protein
VSFPDAIQGTSLRAAMRVKVDIPAKVMPSQPDGSAVNCSLTNVSINGARIEALSSLLEDGGEITLEFAVIPPTYDREVRVRVQAAIRNVSKLRRESDGAEVFAYGVQFLDLNPVHHTMLQNGPAEYRLSEGLAGAEIKTPLAKEGCFIAGSCALQALRLPTSDITQESKKW